MINTIEDAIAIAQRYLDEKSLGMEDDLLIFKEKIVEKEYGWIFRYTSRLFMETENILYSVGGNGPIVVARASGKIHALGTAKSFDDIVEAFEQEMGFAKS